MKGKNKENEQIPNAGINAQLMNIIAPSGIDFTDNYASIGDGEGKIYAISRYPSSVDYGWLARLVNLPGTAAVIEYRYSPADVMINAYDKRISDLNSKIELEKKESERAKLEKAIEDLQDMIRRISVKNEPVGYFNIMLHIRDFNMKALNDRIKKVNGIVRSQECGMRHLKFRQAAALSSAAPWGLPNREVANMGERNMPMSTFVGGFPMAAAGLNDPRGHYLGRSKDRLIILDFWMRHKDRTNSNWFIDGVPGVGKSTFLKALMILEYAVNYSYQIVLDAEGEYLEMAQHPWLNGDIIDCASGTSGRINPLQVRYTPRITEDDEEGDELGQNGDYLEYEEMDEGGFSDLALHIQNLRTFFTIYFGKENFQDSGVRRAFEEGLIETYKNKGIDWDTDIKKLKNEDFPIISDFFELIEEKSKNIKLSKKRREDYEKLADMLYPAAKGADQFIWNGITTLNPKSRFVVLYTARLLDMDEKIKKAQFFNIQLWMWHQMSMNREEKAIGWVDEGYLFADPEFPELIKFLRNVSKRGRKYEAALGFITHSLTDILDPAVKRFTQAIIDNACYKFLMGCDGKNLEETVALFKLSEKEESLLAAKNRGRGVLFAGNARMELQVEVTDTMLQIMGKAGGR